MLQTPLVTFAQVLTMTDSSDTQSSAYLELRVAEDALSGFCLLTGGGFRVDVTTGKRNTIVSKDT